MRGSDVTDPINLLQWKDCRPLIDWIFRSTVMQPCKVCNEPAAGYHFGAFTCEGCKSFFGRTCNNPNMSLECRNGNKCEINKKTRTSCKACRLQKCLDVGMSKMCSRYGRRSNSFKMQCSMNEQQERYQEMLNQLAKPQSGSLNALSSLVQNQQPQDTSDEDWNLPSTSQNTTLHRSSRVASRVSVAQGQYNCSNNERMKIYQQLRLLWKEEQRKSEISIPVSIPLPPLSREVLASLLINPPSSTIIPEQREMRVPTVQVPPRFGSISESNLPLNTSQASFEQPPNQQSPISESSNTSDNCKSENSSSAHSSSETIDAQRCMTLGVSISQVDIQGTISSRQPLVILPLNIKTPQVLVSPREGDLLENNSNSDIIPNEQPIDLSTRSRESNEDVSTDQEKRSEENDEHSDELAQEATVTIPLDLSRSNSGLPI